MDPPPSDLTTTSKRPSVQKSEAKSEETEPFSTLKAGLFSEPKNYLIRGSAIKEILEEAYKYNGQFDIAKPGWIEPEGYYTDDDDEDRMYIVRKHKNLAENQYQQLGDDTLFTAVARSTRKLGVCRWSIRGTYPSGNKFYLNFYNIDPL